MSKHTQTFVSLSAAAFLLAIPSVARASLDACGGARVSVGDECEVVPEEQCAVKCDKDAMDTACAAKPDECKEECQPAPDPKCVDTCGEVCVPTCQEEQQQAVLCVSGCTTDCAVKCVDTEDGKECEQTCEQNCGEVCEKDEDDKEPECEPRCAVTCENTCQAQATTQCQVTCRSEQSEECKERVADECELECVKTGSAVFCEEQYLAAAVQQDCTDQLQTELGIVVKGLVQPSEASAAGVDAEQMAGCMAKVDTRGGLGGALMALGIVGIGLARRRRLAA